MTRQVRVDMFWLERNNSMKVTVNERQIGIDLYELVESLPEDALLTFADALAVQDHVIKYVTQQILDGWTERDSSGGRFTVTEVTPVAGLDWACREVAKRASEVSKSEIERLEKSVAYHKECEDNLRKMLNERRYGVELP